MTIKEATEWWVNGFNAVNTGMIEKLMRSEPETWHEMTVPRINDTVDVYSQSQGICSGRVIKEFNNQYVIEIDEGQTLLVGEDEFDIIQDSYLPMWEWMWSFGNSADDYWLEELDGIRIMSRLGFRIYENDDFGYFFGIDGAGYDFYSEHWVPLYKARGLQWHALKD